MGFAPRSPFAPAKQTAAQPASSANRVVIEVTCIRPDRHDISLLRRAMSDETQRPEPDTAVWGVLAALAFGVAILCLVVFAVFGA